MRFIRFLAGMIVFANNSLAQLPYTQNIFSYDSLMDIVYGVETDYAGNTDTLKLDIYKPLNDNNCLRPAIVLVHGGAWVGGSKEDANIVYLARGLARMGWVAAKINYRLGDHKAASYQMYALCNTSISQPCGYICDSSEILRANFRGMQDAKGAIRFMKGRNTIDSTDVNNFFIAGESAGGFISLAAAFTDTVSEKSIDCYAISQAPSPASALIPYGCIPVNNSLSRTDLGDIEGTLHAGQYNAKVMGVGNFYGGVFDRNIFNQRTDTPIIYLFHQGSDVVVHYEYGQVLGRTSWECYAQTNLCQSYYFYPYAYGSKSIADYFAASGFPASYYQSEIVNNYSYLNNCLSNGHSIDNVQTRMQSMANFFALKIAASGNNPATNCLNIFTGEIGDHKAFVFPNPFNDKLIITNPVRGVQVSYSLKNMCGVELAHGKCIEDKCAIDTHAFPAGIYFLLIDSGNKQAFKLVK